MQMSVSYCSFGGRVLYENRGGVESSYARDPLGNTTALLDMSGNQTDSWTYWPYGEVQNHSGSSTTPFTFVGTLGYFVDFANMLYVRARHLKADLTRWMTVDPIFPSQSAYNYVDNQPILSSDPIGLVNCYAVYNLCVAAAYLFGGLCVALAILVALLATELCGILAALCLLYIAAWLAAAIADCVIQTQNMLDACNLAFCNCVAISEPGPTHSACVGTPILPITGTGSCTV